MKNLLLALSLIASTIPTLRAQTPVEISKATEKNNAFIPMSKGSRFLGLNGTGGLSNGVFGAHNTWTATGQGGYFVANRLLVGIQFSYGEINQSLKEPALSSPNQALSQYHIKTFTPELFGRYYFTKGKVKPFHRRVGILRRAG